jgi:hypothetical protein
VADLVDPHELRRVCLVVPPRQLGGGENGGEEACDSTRR